MATVRQENLDQENLDGLKVQVRRFNQHRQHIARASKTNQFQAKINAYA